MSGSKELSVKFVFRILYLPSGSLNIYAPVLQNSFWSCPMSHGTSLITEDPGTGISRLSVADIITDVVMGGGGLWKQNS